MAALNWTAEAAAWLEQIHDYIAEDNPPAALRLVSSLYDRAQVLCDVPDLGHLYKTRAGRVVRILPYGHYRIAYLVKDGGDIDVLGVFHGALDLDRYLK